jgi:hypothetical protein
MAEGNSFWTTLPGILTAIGAIIVAVTGLYVAINQPVTPTPAPIPVVPTTLPTTDLTTIPTTIITTSPPIDISGSYSTDGDTNRRVTIYPISGNRYSIGQPIGAWPWSGTAELNGIQLVGKGMALDSPATFDIYGTVIKDGSIQIRLSFTTNDQGKIVAGEVANHVYIPIK